MMLTTKSRYAVMALVEVGAKSAGLPVKLADISESQDIPLNYLEQIFLKLKRADIVGAVKGPGGGYLLKTDIDQISIVNIIDAVEENTKMTRCGNGRYCTKDNTKCKTHNLWKGLGQQIRGYLSSVSIADVLSGNIDIK
jgi:Rrf2 family transcriptional regulator, iron-sulfur cluster assembly transcription factor